MPNIKKMNHESPEPIVSKLIPSSLRRRLPVDEEAKKAKDTFAFWWYRTLQLSDAYQACIKSGGNGKLAELYADFGNVNLFFDLWWRKQGRKIFSEQKPLKDVIVLDSYKKADDEIDNPERLVISIPLTLRKATAMRKIHQVLAKAYEERESVDIWRASSARRMIIKTRVQKSTIEQLLRLLHLRRTNPEITLNELGKRAGLELDLMARSTEGEVITEQLERRRMSIAVSRQLLQAKHLIENAERGVFPKLTAPSM